MLGDLASGRIHMPELQFHNLFRSSPSLECDFRSHPCLNPNADLHKFDPTKLRFTISVVSSWILPQPSKDTEQMTERDSMAELIRVSLALLELKRVSPKE